MAKFYLRTSKKTGVSPLYVRYKKFGKIVMINSGIKVDIEKWTRANTTASEWKKFISHKYGYDISVSLDKISECMNRCSASNITDPDEIKKCIYDVLFAPIKKAEDEAKKAEVERIKEEIQIRNNDPVYFINKFIEGIEAGTIRNKGNRYSSNTVKVWKTFQKELLNFYNEKKFSFDDIDRVLADRYVAHLEKHGYLPKTINKHIIDFRAIINYAYQSGVHTNVNASKCFYKVRVTDDDKQNEIYLTENEVDELYRMPLIGTEALYRDVFLCGVYTCQRFSDYSDIKEYNFGTTAKGTKVIRIQQTKTKNSVVIPILNDNLITIAKRYNYNIPNVSDVVLNRYIKNILKDLSEKVPSLANEVPTVLTMKEVKMENDGKKSYKRDKYGRPVKCRYDMVSSHTARRTGITLLYLTQKFDVMQMMSISGHKDVKTFMEYIRLTKDEIADNIATKSKQEVKIIQNDGLF